VGDSTPPSFPNTKPPHPPCQQRIPLPLPLAEERGNALRQALALPLQLAVKAHARLEVAEPPQGSGGLGSGGLEGLGPLYLPGIMGKGRLVGHGGVAQGLGAGGRGVDNAFGLGNNWIESLELGIDEALSFTARRPGGYELGGEGRQHHLPLRPKTLFQRHTPGREAFGGDKGVS